MNKRFKYLLPLACLALAILVLLLQLRHRPQNQLQSGTFRFARTDWLAEQQISDQADLTCLERSLRSAEMRAAAPPNHEQPLFQLLLEQRSGQEQYWLTHDLLVFNQGQNQQLLVDAPGQSVLQRYADQLRREQFGELLPWSEVKQLLPIYSIFTVVDLETGLCFQTQRRAGSSHADIQPLTKQDTEILRTICDGEWSWNRRAVVVEAGGRRIAASMHSMPHGAGALVNGFPGHHCLHFFGSSTHGGGRSDPLHQLMVQQAAGQLHEYLEQMPPVELQAVALELVGQGNTDITSLLIRNSGNGVEQLASRIRDIHIWGSKLDEVAGGVARGSYSVSVFFVDDQREYRTTVQVTCCYDGGLGRWLVEPNYLQQLINAHR
jgi:hypothetical protein